MAEGKATIPAAELPASSPEGTHSYRIVVTSPNSATSNEVGVYMSTPPSNLTVCLVSIGHRNFSSLDMKYIEGKFSIKTQNL